MKRLFLFGIFLVLLILGYMWVVDHLHFYSESESQALSPKELESSLGTLSQKVGIQPALLKDFYLQFQKRNQKSDLHREDTIPAETFSDLCIAPLREAQAAPQREQFIRCVTEHLPLLFNVAHYHMVTALRVSLSHREAARDRQMAIVLLSWIEDLLREKYLKDGTDTFWYDHQEERFLNVKKPSDFPYQDGDIVIGIGSSAVSALIAGVMDPHRGYSHAMMIRRDPSEPMRVSIIDAQIEDGVTEKSITKLDESKYEQLLVLRLSDKYEQTSSIVARASSIAKTAAEENMPYDEAMDADDHSKIFCSELVGFAYANAASEVLQKRYQVKDIGPIRARVRSPDAMKFLNLLGVQNELIPSPGDLVTSQHLQVVADYRKMDDPLLYWQVLLAGEAFLAGVEEGQEVRVDPYEIWPLVTAACLFDKPLWLLGTILDSDLRIIPGAVTCDAAKIIKTHSDKIHDRLLAMSDRVIERSEKTRTLLEVPPWFIYASMHRELRDPTGIGWYFQSSPS